MTDNACDKVVYSGRLLNYFLIAYKEFSKDQNALSNFMIHFYENESEIEVLFSPNLAPGERILGGRTSLGYAVSYIISKKDYKILKRQFRR